MKKQDAVCLLGKSPYLCDPIVEQKQIKYREK